MTNQIYSTQLTFGEMELRRRQVSGMDATMRLEGFSPDASDLAIQAKYVRGEANLEDLFEHAMGLACKSEVQVEMIGYVLGDLDDGAAARAHLAEGRPITYTDDSFPDRIIRKRPDGRRELIDVDLRTGKVIIGCDHLPDGQSEQPFLTKS